MRYYPSFPMVIPLYQVGYLRVTHPFATNHRNDSFHLHVLGMPPAFILSQDQTLLILITPSSRRNFFCLILAQIDVIVYIYSLILFFILFCLVFKNRFALFLSARI